MSFVTKILTNLFKKLKKKKPTPPCPTSSPTNYGHGSAAIGRTLTHSSRIHLFIFIDFSATPKARGSSWARD